MFDAAVQDLQDSLDLKLKLYDVSDPIISEAHYKLSLALEFATQIPVEERKTRAMEQIVAAISSVRVRVALLEREGKEAEARDAKDMIEELEVKLGEMKEPVKPDVAGMFSGGLGEILQQKLRETLGATDANDLTGLVRKKPKESGEKRKLEDTEEEGVKKR
jgi:HAT1-interacting factor 1